MKLAFTISSYRLVDFVRLGLAQLSKLSPDSPVVVSDDRSQESHHIEAAAGERGAAYACSRVRKGHFSADFQSIINALVFAKAVEADVAVKISQRFILRKPESIDVIRKAFEDPNIVMATPGQPSVTNGTRAAKGFSQFSILTDVVMFRVGAITPEDLLVMYRARIIRERVPWASFIECTIDQLHSQFSGRTAKLQELTNQPDLNDPIYLRRYQNTEQQYRDLALGHGWNGQFPVAEWGSMEQRNYMCKPLVV